MLVLIAERCSKAGLALALLVLALVACAPPAPLRIGFLGGLSGRVADLGIGGRNGATIAVELRNQSGGIGGRPVELLVEDDQQDAAVAKKAVASLIDRKVEAIVGPMTSAMAVEILPLVNQANLLTVSPTVATNAVTGLDDMFLRVTAPTADVAGKSARAHRAAGWRRVVAVIDERNLVYTESWLNDYRAALIAGGGELIDTLRFASSDSVHFVELAERVIRTGADSVVIVANSVDTAILAQQLHKSAPRLRLGASEWAATERLTELGGKAVEGMLVAQFIDRESRAPAYLAFSRIYRERFGQDPGYAGLAGFDAMNVVLEGLAAKTSGQSLKQAILTRKTFAGAQGEIRFDASGDAARETFVTTIRAGKFVRL